MSECASKCPPECAPEPAYESALESALEPALGCAWSEASEAPFHRALEAIAGTTVSATNSDDNRENDTVNDSSVNRCPANDLRKTTGRKTAIVVRVDAAIAGFEAL